ncbi:MAG: hypothetical protein C5B59_14015 [Bacteroidetes bacterium]|nr:MAG: hypothetical protein C5B59_14015 [Bacteroidota bacterium]
MSSIYLIRHTAPSISKGVCYGQSDIDVMDSFYDEAEVIRRNLPHRFGQIHSSPLSRCKKLASFLFPEQEIIMEKDLMEIHCGYWELRDWDQIPRHEIDPWMADFVQISIPGGESYLNLYRRVVPCFLRIASSGQDAAVVTHGGVIRSILSHITQTSLVDSFSRFPLHYGCIIHISKKDEEFRYEIVSNIRPSESEKHKPSYFRSKSQ